MRKKNSILFVRPDYHCSFFYRDEFRKRGWKADVFVNQGYPLNLLYSNQDVLRIPQLRGGRFFFFIRWINLLLPVIWWLSKYWRYKYHLYYGRPPVLTLFENNSILENFFGKDFLIELWIAKITGVKLIFLPTGCHDDESKENISKLDNGAVCGNCGVWDQCNDRLNDLSFSRIRRYFDMQIGLGTIDSSQFTMSHIKYKSIDLSLWSPDLSVPQEQQLTPTKNIRILHSSYLEKSGRNFKGRNIKGSPFILNAIERLKNEGYPVEYYYINDKPSNQMRFYQVQADIVVEQLIYGWWGSTGVETMALGRPVVCYLRPSWKEFFFKTFPEYNNLPIVEANIGTIYETLKKLVIDETYRRQKGEESRRFAEAHFNPKKNTRELIKIMEEL